jgi:hypothetical protein
MKAPLFRPALAVFALLAGIYLFTTGGHTYASDEEQMFAVSEALVTRGSFALAPATPTQPARYSSYGPGQPLLGVPFYLLGRSAASQFPPEAYAFVTRALVSWLNPLVTAATAALIAVAALRMGYSQRAAIGGALIYGLASVAWPHSKTFFAEPLAACFLFASFALLVLPAGRSFLVETTDDRRPTTGGNGPAIVGRRSSIVTLFIAGLLAGLAPAVKLQAGLALPLLGLWVLWIGLRRGGFILRQHAAAIRFPAIWSFGVCCSLALLGLYQWQAFGSPFTSGYGNASGVFTYDLGKGLYGLLFSSGKGVFWYNPPLLLWPLGIVLLWRRERGVALLCAAIVVAHLLLYGKVIFWHGDGAWGPRYLNICLPFFFFPLVTLLERQGGRETGGQGNKGTRGHRCVRIALVATLVLAIPVQFGALTTNLNAYLETQRDDPLRYYSPYWSPIAGHLRMAGQRLSTMAEQSFAPNSVVLGPGFAYSEGDRANGEQLPRWSRAQATIALRSTSEPLLLTMALDGCRPNGVEPALLKLRIAATVLEQAAVCPGRVYRMLLPNEANRLELVSSTWNPILAGIDRDGPLGVRLTSLAASANGQPLTVRGELIPIPPMPAGHVALRSWAGDPRYGQWDFWWWYLWVGQPPSPGRWLLSVLWLAVAGGLVGVGVRLMKPRE